MYEETGCFDPNTVAEGADDGFSQPVLNQFAGNLKRSPDEPSYHHRHYQHKPPPPREDAAGVDAMELELQKHMAFNVENSGNNNNNIIHLMPPVVHDPNQVLSSDHSNWSTEIHDVGFNEAHNQDDHHDPQQNPYRSNTTTTNFDINNPSSLPETLYSQPPDLLNPFHLPRFLPDSSISFANHDSTTPLGFTGDLPASDCASVLNDPLFHLNLPPQPQSPLFRELFQSVPQGYNLMSSRGGGNSLFGDERDSSGVAYQDGDGINSGQFDNRVFEFTRDMACIVRGRGAAGKFTKQAERHRRENLADRYNALKSLVPSPTKTDRASIVGDAIGYIKELLRTVNELKLLVDKKRCGRERSKRHKTEEDGAAGGDVEKCNLKPLVVAEGGDQSYNGSLRSSWIQRKSKDTEVDVRIIDDEVTIKLVQRKKIDCLLFVSKILEELQLDLHHVAGGHIGDYYSFLFNTKIYEGSSVYAGAIAGKLIEVMDRQYAAVPQTSSY